MKYSLLILSLFALSLSAKVLISPVDAMKQNYGNDAVIVKKNMLLSKAQALNIQKNSSTKLKKVRSKNAVVLYFISKDNILKSIEIIAFNEPLEYLPSDKWNSQFENVSTDKMLRVSREIPTITGATLSARSITDGSRVAFAFYNEVLKDK